MIAASISAQGFPLQSRAHAATAAKDSAAVAAPSGSDALLKRVNVEQKLNEKLPLDLKFRDETGTPVQLGAYFGRKPVILAMVYYECPMLCGLVLDGLLSNLKLLRLEVGSDFDIVTVSIDPGETATTAAAKKAELMAKYGFQSAGLEAGWHALTGSQDAIDRLAETVGFRYLYDVGTDEYAHGAAIMIVTPERSVARYFYGIEYPPLDVRLGLVEAASNRIGTLADQLFLLCYRYDAATGKYDFAIWSAIRLAGGLTLLLLGGFIAWSLRRERGSLHTTAAGGGHGHR